MTCNDFTNDLLLDSGRPEPREHLAACAACRARAAELRVLAGQLRAAAPPALPDAALVRRIVGRLRPAPRRIVHRPGSPGRWVAAAAAVLAVAIVLVLAIRESPVEPPSVARPSEKPPIEMILDPVPSAPKEAPKPAPEIEIPRPPAPVPLPDKPAPAPAPQPPVPAPTPEKPAPSPVPPPPTTIERPPARVFVAVASVEGILEIGGKRVDKGAEWEKGSALRAGERLSRIALADGRRLTLKARAELRLDDADTISLNAGEIFCEVVPGAGRKLAVVTPDARIDVVGTQFAVKRTDHTEIVVSAGEVKVSNDKGSVAVAAGNGTTARKGSAPARPRPVDPDAMTGWRRLEVEASKFHYDFEDGRRPLPWQDGKVGPGPGRGFNKSCLEGAPGINLDLSRVDKRISTVKGTLKLRFRYYATGGDMLWVQLMDERVRDNFRVEVKNLVHDRWETFEAPLSDFFLLIDGAAKIQEGDRLTWLNVSVSGTKGPVYFDDIELVEVMK